MKNIEWEIGDAVDAMQARMVAKVTQRFGHVRIYNFNSNIKLHNITLTVHDDV